MDAVSETQDSDESETQDSKVQGAPFLYRNMSSVGTYRFQRAIPRDVLDRLSLNGKTYWYWNLNTSDHEVAVRFSELLIRLTDEQIQQARYCKVPPPKVSMTIPEDADVETLTQTTAPLSEPAKEDVIVRPSHYTRFVIEPIIFIMKNRLPFWLGNVIKYGCRAGHKLYDGMTAVESEKIDIRKMIRYCEMRLNELEGKGVL